MYLQQGVLIKLKKYTFKHCFYYIYQGVTIMKWNMPRDESLAPENFCTVLFSRSKLKITMKLHRACCMSQYYTSNLCLCTVKFKIASWRLHVSALGEKLCKHVMEKIFKYWRKCNKKSISINLLLKSLLSKLLTHLRPTKRICVQLGHCTQITLSHWSFSRQSQLDFFYSHSFSCSLYSDDFSWQVSDEKL